MAYTLKFSSPPASCAYRMYFESRLQKYCRTGRVVSLLIGRAALKGSPAFFTQMLRVPLYGFQNERYCPSGAICAPPIGISPKNAARSIIGGCSALTPLDISTQNVAITTNTVLLMDRLHLTFNSSEAYSGPLMNSKHRVTKNRNLAYPSQ